MHGSVRGAAGVMAAVVSLGLLACSKPPPEVPAPVPVPVPAEVVVMPSDTAASTSVPDAGAALGTANAGKEVPVAGRTNKAMSRADESSAMPMPGQNNDHSAPLPPARRASSS